MTGTRYLVVGGGMTGDAACKGIREHDTDGTITLVGAEPDPPYKRPPLTKGLWSGGDEAKIWRQTDEAGVDLRLGRRIVSIDPAARSATDDQGEEYSYERLLLATGGTPRQLAGAPADVVYYRTLQDYRRVRELADRQARFAVIGGGFIGSELAAALASNGCRVTMVFPEPGIAWRIFPSDLAEAVNTVYRDRGVEVLAGETVTTVEGDGDEAVIRLGSGGSVRADAVIAGLGIEPTTALAEAIGLPTDNGIVVDEYGRVDGADGVFAAGDVARFPIALLGRNGRVEHEDHANTHGRVVGANMAGAAERYDHLPFFYSDLFDLGYEAVGDTDSRLRTVTHWVEPHGKGVVAYVDDDGRPVGFLLWDVWGKVDAARELIAAREPVDEETVAQLA
ncbi:MAG TPA: FAD-dependent oxidoreductase [Gaiellaceae bacterium]|nr:FAD-dependent oxidoreductase [Gaiellaceae bacterium]